LKSGEAKVKVGAKHKTSVLQVDFPLFWRFICYEQPYQT